MKKIMSFVFGLVFLGAFIFPAINAGNLTTVNAVTGWYSFDYTSGTKAVVLRVGYTKGSETQVNIEIGEALRPWTRDPVMLSDRGADDVAANVKLIVNATAERYFYIETVRTSGTMFFHVYSTGALAGTVLLNAEEKK